MKAIRRHNVYGHLNRRSIHFNTIPLVFILSMLLNACQKEALETPASKILSTEQQNCIELMCLPNVGITANASIEADGGLFWVSIELVKACDAVVITEQTTAGDSLIFNFSIKEGLADNCSCKSKYRYECSTGSGTAKIVVNVRNEAGELLFEKCGAIKKSNSEE